MQTSREGLCIVLLILEVLTASRMDIQILEPDSLPLSPRLLDSAPSYLQDLSYRDGSSCTAEGLPQPILAHQVQD